MAARRLAAVRDQPEEASLGPEKFLLAFPARLKKHLPSGRQGYSQRRRWGLLQFYYGDPRHHFEIWPRTSAGLVEIGLHLEADVETNEKTLEAIGRQANEVREALGCDWDAEAWT